MLLLLLRGDGVTVIEHRIDDVKAAHWVIDPGPEGGDASGKVVAVGTPEQIARVHASYTGRYLRPLLDVSARKAS